MSEPKINKKWLPLVIGLVLVLLISTIQLGIGSPGTGISGCNNPPNLLQCGTGVCHDTNHSFCVMSNTFRTAFASTPRNVTGVINGISTDPAGTTPFPLRYYIPAGSVVFQSDNGETWANMPAAVTEIYGTINHENLLTLSNTLGAAGTPTEAQLQASFSIGCLTGSASATAFLKPQYLTGGVWKDLAATLGGLNVLIDSSDCSFSPSPIQTNGGFAFLDHNYNTSIIAITPLRIVGANGNGLADNVVLNNLQLQFAIQQYATFTICTPLAFVCPNVTTLDSKTTIYFEVDWNILAGGFTGVYPWIWVNWQAWQ